MKLLSEALRGRGSLDHIQREAANPFAECLWLKLKRHHDSFWQILLLVVELTWIKHNTSVKNNWRSEVRQIMSHREVFSWSEKGLLDNECWSLQVILWCKMCFSFNICIATLPYIFEQPSLQLAPSLLPLKVLIFSPIFGNESERTYTHLSPDFSSLN